MGYDEKADSWGLGILMYQLITGKQPFIDTDKDRLTKKIGFKEPKFSESQWRHCRDVKPLVQQLLQKNPHDRPTMAQIANNPCLKGEKVQRNMF